MAVDGLKRLFCGHRVGTVWAQLVRIQGRGTQILRYRWNCRGHFSSVWPAPPRTVSGWFGASTAASSPRRRGSPRCALVRSLRRSGSRPGRRRPAAKGRRPARLTVVEEVAYARAAQRRTICGPRGSGILTAIPTEPAGSGRRSRTAVVRDPLPGFVRGFVREAPSAEDADGAPRAEGGGQPTWRGRALSDRAGCYVAQLS
jgi:hypothetical protein